MQSKNIANIFFEAAKKYPTNIAIIHNDRVITYKELETDVFRTAKYFKNAGIEKGDRVLIFVPMSIDLYRIVLAIFSIGAVAVFLDEWVSKKRMELCCEIAQCKGFVGITKARIFSLFSKPLRTIPVKLKINGYKEYNVASENELIFDCSENDTALITFTTGSMGTPKAAKRTHGFLKEQFDALIEKIKPNEKDVDLPVLPIVLLINLGAGATSVIFDYKASKPKLFKPELVIKTILKYQVNRITSSPYFIKELSKYVLKNCLEVTIDKIFTGGAPVFPKEAQIYTKAFPNTDIQIVYGSTEAEPISSISALELIGNTKNNLSNGLNVGKTYHKAEVKIIEIDEKPITVTRINQLKELPALKIGEIIVAGPHVLTEYFNNNEALKHNKIFVENKVYHRTGDSGFFDKEGTLFLTGRCSTLFKQNEKYISPFLIEDILQSIPGVEIGTVLFKNNQTKIILELNDFNQKEHIKEQISQLSIKTDEIIVLDEIPRDPRHNSKIDYDKLRLKLS